MQSSTRSQSSGLATALLALLAASGCQELDLPSIRYETNRTRIGTSFDDPLCAADLAWFDPQVEFIERLSGVTRSEPIEIYIYGNDNEPPCSSSPIGCYYYEEDIIAGYWPSIDHEMVHAVTSNRVNFPSKFWEEGTAEALSLEGTDRAPSVTLSPEVTRSDKRPNYDVAGHFVRFLYEDFGEEAAQQLINGAPVEDVTGLSLEGLIALHDAEAPHSYAARNPCPEPTVPQLDDGSWGATYNFSCESEDASQFEGLGAGIVRILELDSWGEYDVLIEGGDGVRIVACQMENLDSEPPEFSHGDIMNQAELDQTAFGTFFDADVPHRLTMTEGRYRFALSSEHNDETQMTVRVTKR